MRLSSLQNAFFISLVLLISVCFFWLIQDFWLPLFWALLFSVFFQPLNLRISKFLGGRKTVASLLTVLIFTLLVLVPLIMIFVAVMNESLNLYQRISSGQIDVQKIVIYVQEYLPVVTDYLDKFGIGTQKVKQWLTSSAVTVSQYVASRLMVFGQNALNFAVMTVLMVYVLFFFLRDGKKVVSKLIRAVPVGDSREIRLINRFTTVARATIKGTFVVALVQGSLGGLLFYLLGIQAAVFWGVIMTLLSVLPAVGSSIIWGPAAVVLLVTGQIVPGIVLLVSGSVIIGSADNLLRPLLVGKDTELPDYLVLLSTLGGLALIGISGFVIGPVVAALFLSVWEMFGEEFGFEQDLEDFDQKGITSDPEQ